MSDIGLVLGVTCGVFGTCIAYISYIYCKRRPTTPLQLEAQTSIEITTTHLAIQDVLTPQSFDDLQTGYLSNNLKDELMIYRLRQKRELVEFIEYAKEHGFIPIMDFCKNLDPPNYPPHIFYKIAQIQPPTITI